MKFNRPRRLVLRDTVAKFTITLVSKAGLSLATVTDLKESGSATLRQIIISPSVTVTDK